MSPSHASSSLSSAHITVSVIGVLCLSSMPRSVFLLLHHQCRCLLVLCWLLTMSAIHPSSSFLLTFQIQWLECRVCLQCLAQYYCSFCSKLVACLFILVLVVGNASNSFIFLAFFFFTHLSDDVARMLCRSSFSRSVLLSSLQRFGRLLVVVLHHFSFNQEQTILVLRFSRYFITWLRGSSPSIMLSSCTKDSSLACCSFCFAMARTWLSLSLFFVRCCSFAVLSCCFCCLTFVKFFCNSWQRLLLMTEATNGREFLAARQRHWNRAVTTFADKAVL